MAQRGEILVTSRGELSHCPPIAHAALPGAAVAATRSFLPRVSNSPPVTGGHQGYHYYGPQSGSFPAKAVFVDGVTLCGPLSPSLAGLMVVSDGIGCHLHGCDLYAKLEAVSVSTFVWMLPFTCPRVRFTVMTPLSVPRNAQR